MEPVQNVTLAIPKKLLRKAKILAIQRNTSLSGLLTQTLADLVAHKEGYDQARDRSMATIAEGFELGTKGNADWTREALHER